MTLQPVAQASRFATNITIDLPCPPSVNRIWRANRAGPKRVSISKEYETWKRRADALTLSTGQFRGLKMVKGPFEAEIILKRVRGDLDNRTKGVLDWLQSRGVIVDDKFCERLTVSWGDAPTGCRVTVRAFPTVNDVLRATAERLEGIPS